MPLHPIDKPVAYINTQTNQVVSEQEIKLANPNTSFSIPFNPPTEYKWIFPSPQPTVTLLQFVREIAPILTVKGHYEQQWEIVDKYATYTDAEGVIHTKAELEAAAIALDTQTKTAALLATYVNALTAHLDTVAQSHNYDNRITCSVRAAYPGPYQAEGIAFGTWMDTVNQLGYQMVADYQAGLIPLPTIEEMIASLPVMVWPGQ